MKTILIPTDFSESAHNATRYAVSLFGKESRYILLNTWIPPYTPPEVLISVEDVLMKSSKEGLENELLRLVQAPGLEHITFETLSELGGLTEVIRSVADERKADFVVMGTQGATGLQEMLIGSNTASAAKTLDCPLIIVPSDASFTGVKTMVFAADYKELINDEVLKPMIDLAKELNAEIKVLNVLDKGKITDVEQGSQGLRLDKQLTGLPHNYTFTENDDKAAGIDEYLNSTATQLLVMLEHKLGFFKSIFHRSITKQMAFHTHVPMLVLHSGKS